MRVKFKLTKYDYEAIRELLCQRGQAAFACEDASSCNECINDASIEDFKVYLKEQLDET